MAVQLKVKPTVYACKIPKLFGVAESRCAPRKPLLLHGSLSIFGNRLWRHITITVNGGHEKYGRKEELNCYVPTVLCM
jgi:hypothetical protein